MKKSVGIFTFVSGIAILTLLFGIFTNRGVHAAGPKSGVDVNVLNVDNAAHQRFQAGGMCTIGVNNSSCRIDINVPSNKLWVIETVSGRTTTDVGQVAVFDVFVSQNPNGAEYFFSPPLVGNFSPNTNQFQGTTAVRLYADPGTTVSVDVSRSGSGTQKLADVFLSGYLVDCGAGQGCPFP